MRNKTTLNNEKNGIILMMTAFGVEIGRIERR